GVVCCIGSGYHSEQLPGRAARPAALPGSKAGWCRWSQTVVPGVAADRRLAAAAWHRLFTSKHLFPVVFFYGDGSQLLYFATGWDDQTATADKGHCTGVS